MTTVEEAVAALRSINLQSLQYEVEVLRAIKDWAMDQLDLDYKPGDRVVIVSTEPSTAGGGWAHYNEALAPGQTGIAREIEFDRNNFCWRVMVEQEHHPDGCVKSFSMRVGWVRKADDAALAVARALLGGTQ